MFPDLNGSRLVSSASARTCLSRLRPEPRAACLEQLEERTLFSYSISTVAEFDPNTNGGSPIAIVTDSSGNLFGVALANSPTDTNALGEVFEIPVGSNSISVLYRFTGGTDGGRPTGLVIDSNNNLFGGTSIDGPDGHGTTFEILAGTSTPILLAPQAITPAWVDSSGNLYGRGDGGVAELLSGQTSLTEISTVFGNSLTLGADGNLYGTVGMGQNVDGSTNGGEVFEVNLTNMTTSILATFPFDESTLEGSDGSEPTGVAVDASGNVFGVTAQGGNADGGVAFEIAKGSNTITPIDFFSQNATSVGGTPISPPLLGVNDNLYGINFNGGANSVGSLWEIPGGSGAVTESQAQPAIDLADFSQDNAPIGSPIDLIPDNGPASSSTPQTSASSQASDSSPQFYYSAQLGGTPMGADKTSGGNGSVNKASPGNSPPPKNGAPNPKPQKDKMKQLRDELEKEMREDTKERERAGSTVQSNLEQSFQQANSDLNSANAQLNSATQFYNHDNSELKTIANLTAQLADTKNPTAQARIQNKLTADQGIESNDSSGDNTAYNTASADLDTVTTLEASIQTTLISLPTPFIALSGAFTTVPTSLTPGKKAVAVLAITNSGNETASGSLTVGLSIRPVGISGADELTVKPIKVAIHITSDTSSSKNVNFLVPKNLLAGSYSLVVQLDPNNAFKESSLPIAIVSTTIPAT